MIVFGLGGVGSYAVEGLVQSGIGHLALVDFDEVHTCDHRTQVNGSVGFVTSVFGMNAAGVVVRRIAHGR